MIIFAILTLFALLVLDRITDQIYLENNGVTTVANFDCKLPGRGLDRYLEERCIIVYTFTDSNGKKIKNNSTTTKCQIFGKQSKFDIIYDPRNPEYSQLKGESFILEDIILFLILICGTVFSGIFVKKELQK